MDKHTLTPWKVLPFDGDTSIVYDKNMTVVIPKLQNKDRAAFIVRAVNAHEELVAALEAYETQYTKLGGFSNLTTPYIACHAMAHLALQHAKAEGK